MRQGKHRCYRCLPMDADNYRGETEKLGGVDATLSDSGDEVYFVSGYSAREIAQKRASELQARIYVNNVSREIKRPDLSVPVSYAVSKSPVYTVREPDEWHDTLYKVYWPPLS